MRLLDHLRTLGLSSKAAREALQTGKVLVHGVPTADGGREVEPANVRYDASLPRVVPGRDAATLHADESLVVAWKPAGMLVVPAPHRTDAPVLLERMGRRFGALYPVHRLDEETSGLVVMARTPAIQATLKDAFAVHAVERRYVAFVRGKPPAPPKAWRSVLVRDRGDGLRGSLAAGQTSPDGKEAVTWLEEVSSLTRGVWRVGVRLETGRTHQVRIHLSEVGCPVLGDPLYAPQGVARMMQRLALHAAVLGFTHPVTGQPMRWEAPLADDLESWARDWSAPKPEADEAPPPKPRRDKRKR